MKKEAGFYPASFVLYYYKVLIKLGEGSAGRPHYIHSCRLRKRRKLKMTNWMKKLKQAKSMDNSLLSPEFIFWILYTTMTQGFQAEYSFPCFYP
jgi:hypothetical protein